MISGTSRADIFSTPCKKEIKKEYNYETNRNEDNFATIQYLSDVKYETQQPNDDYLCDIKEEGQEVDFDVNEINCNTIEDINYVDNEIKEEISEISMKCIITEGVYSCCNSFTEEGILSILNNSTTAASAQRALKTIPANYLVFKKGIFTLKCLPKNIIFGPYTGLESLRSNSGFGWKLNSDKTLAELDNSKHKNWMRYINMTLNKSQQNLCVFQWNGFLYYRSVREINCGEELFVHLEEYSIRDFSSEIGKYYYPPEEEIPNIFSCIPCCLGFSLEEYLQKHKISHCVTKCYKSDDIVHCPICKTVAFEKKYLKYHIKSDCCGFISKSRIPQDIEQLYKCNVCNAVYTHKTNLARHKRKHTGVKYLSCHQCGYRTEQKTTLRKHMSMHTKEFACAKCDFISDCRGSLQDHTAKIHPPNSQSDNRRGNNATKSLQICQKIDPKDVAEFKCSICNRVLTEKGSLKRHLRVHTGEKPYNCDFCDYRCSQVGSLSKHVKRHTGEKPHVCKICNMRFLEKCKLKRHMKVHLVERFYCSKCNYKTRSGSALDKHVNTCHAFDELII